MDTIGNRSFHTWNGPYVLVSSSDEWHTFFAMALWFSLAARRRNCFVSRKGMVGHGSRRQQVTTDPESINRNTEKTTRHRRCIRTPHGQCSRRTHRRAKSRSMLSFGEGGWRVGATKPSQGGGAGTVTFLRLLAAARARREGALLRRRAEQGWRMRWRGCWRAPPHVPLLRRVVGAALQCWWR